MSAAAPKHGNIVVLTSAGNMQLASAVAAYVGAKAHDVTQCFSNGETGVRIPISVRDHDVYVVQSTSSPSPNDNMMALCIMLQAAKLAHPHRITAVIPCLGYARQDRKSKAREPITARLCADFIALAGADRVITIDLHADQIQGMFSIPVDHLSAENIFVTFIKRHYCSAAEGGPSSVVIVAPDAGSAKRARDIANKIGCDFALIHKHRPKPNEVDAAASKLVGDVRGKTAIMVDDMIDTAGTLCSAASLLKSAAVGAARVVAFATHGILSGPAIERLAACDALDAPFVTDTIPVADAEQNRRKEHVNVLSVASLLGESIRRSNAGESMSDLFQLDNPFFMAMGDSQLSL